MSENVIFEVDDGAAEAPAAEPEKAPAKRAKRELSAEQKQALVERLKKAREAKQAKRNNAKNVPAVKSPAKSPEVVKEQKQEIKEDIKEIKQEIKEAKTDGASNAELAALMKQLDRLNGNLEKLSRARTPKKVEIKEPPAQPKKSEPAPTPQPSPTPTPPATPAPAPAPIVYNLKNQRRRLF